MASARTARPPRSAARRIRLTAGGSRTAVVWIHLTGLDPALKVQMAAQPALQLAWPAIAGRRYELWQTERLEVRPGLTGLWQVTGRRESTALHCRARSEPCCVAAEAAWVRSTMPSRLVS